MSTMKRKKRSYKVKNKTPKAAKKKVKLPDKVKGIEFYEDGSLSITSPAIRGRIALDLLDEICCHLKRAIVEECNRHYDEEGNETTPSDSTDAGPGEMEDPPPDGDDCGPIELEEDDECADTGSSA